MNEDARELLVKCYLRGDALRAWKKLSELVRKDPEAAWDVVLRIIRRAPRRELFLIGVGPLAELVSVEHDRLRDRVIAELRSSPRFLEAFRFVRVREAPQTTRRELRTAMLLAGVPEAELYDRP